MATVCGCTASGVAGGAGARAASRPPHPAAASARATSAAATTAAALVALALAAAGCGGREAARAPAPPATPEAVQPQTVAMWRSQFEQHKAQWNELFQGDDSPLPETRRASFEGQGFY